MLHAAAEARVLSAFGAIHGVLAREVKETDAVFQGMRAYHVDLSGWSPSLHRVEIRLRGRIPTATDLDAQRQGAALMRAFAMPLRLQRERAAQGLALGAARPFDPKLGIVTMMHMTIDRGLLTLLDEEAHGPPHNVISSINDLHMSEHDGGHLIQSDDAVEDCSYRTMLRLAPGVFYDGLDVSIEGHDVPETVRQAVAGRRLGEIVEVPAAIAGHEIVRWTDDTSEAGWTNIRIVPDPVRFSDAPQLWGPDGEGNKP